MEVIFLMVRIYINKYSYWLDYVIHVTRTYNF